MKNLVEGYWEENSRIIKWYCFVPWLLYLMFVNILFVEILKSEEKDPDGTSETSHRAEYILSPITLIPLLYQIWIEY